MPCCGREFDILTSSTSIMRTDSSRAMGAQDTHHVHKKRRPTGAVGIKAGSAANERDPRGVPISVATRPMLFQSRKALAAPFHVLPVRFVLLLLLPRAQGAQPRAEFRFQRAVRHAGMQPHLLFRGLLQCLSISLPAIPGLLEPQLARVFPLRCVA